MPSYEYKTAMGNMTFTSLCEHGRDGWRLVCELKAPLADATSLLDSVERTFVFEREVRRDRTQTNTLLRDFEDAAYRNAHAGSLPPEEAQMVRKEYRAIRDRLEQMLR